MKNLLPVLWAAVALYQCTAPASVVAGNVSPIQEGYVDANGVLIYFAEFGHGPSLVVLHGGPGASHDYLLPWLLPLARSNQLLFIDERGSGRSERVQDVHQYTVENMVEDLEAVRAALGFDKISLLGHSYGGVLAQALRSQVSAAPESPRSCLHFPLNQQNERGPRARKSAPAAGQTCPPRGAGEGRSLWKGSGLGARPLVRGISEAGRASEIYQLLA